MDKYPMLDTRSVRKLGEELVGSQANMQTAKPVKRLVVGEVWKSRVPLSGVSSAACPALCKAGGWRNDESLTDGDERAARRNVDDGCDQVRRNTFKAKDL